MPQIRAPWYVVPLALAAAVVLAACGGGADDPLRRDIPPAHSPPPANCSPVAPAAAAEATPSVTAVVGGLMSDASGPRWLIFVANSDGTAIAFYGEDVATVSNLSGYIFAGGAWWSESDPTNWYNGKDWPLGGPDDAVCLEVAYDPATPSLAGSMRRRSGAGGSISGGPIPGSSYTCGQPADAAAASGRWVLNTGATITVSDTGEFTGSHGGCSYKAALSPAADGRNWFRLTMQLAVPCGLLLAPLQGFAVAYTVGGAQRLLMFAETNNGVDSTVFNAIGVRPLP